MTPAARIWLTDLGPPGPPQPIEPTPPAIPQGKDGDLACALAKLRFRSALADYNAAYVAYRRAAA